MQMKGNEMTKNELIAKLQEMLKLTGEQLSGLTGYQLSHYDARPNLFPDGELTKHRHGAPYLIPDQRRGDENDSRNIAQDAI